jgi:hypothetical protein
VNGCGGVLCCVPRYGAPVGIGVGIGRRFREWGTCRIISRVNIASRPRALGLWGCVFCRDGTDRGPADGGHACGTREEGYAAARGRDGTAARARARCRSSSCCEQRTY